MAIPLYDDITSDQLDCIFTEVRPNTLLKISGVLDTGKSTVFCDRIRNLSSKEVCVQEGKKVLVLSTSQSTLHEIRSQLVQNVTRHTFKTLVQEYLSVHHPGWKLLGTDSVRTIRAQLKEQGCEVSYETLKKSIEIISAVTTHRIGKMDEHETRVRFGLCKKAAVELKRLVGDELYIPYAQMMEQIIEFPQFIKYFKNYAYIGVMNFHNLSEMETRFLKLISKDKHLTVIGDEAPKSKMIQFKKNWDAISSDYKVADMKEINLTKVFVDQPLRVNSTAKYSSLKEAFQENKISSANVDQITMAILSLFNNIKNDLALIQVISVIPGIDEKFINKFCDIVSRESNPLFDFLQKYQYSFSDNTKVKLLPVINYLNKIQSKLDNTNPNSIMIHFLNFYKLLGADTIQGGDAKQQFINLHMWFKNVESRKEMQVSNNLIECYINNKTFKRSPKIENLRKYNDQAKVDNGLPTPPTSPLTNNMNGSISINLPVSICMKPVTETPVSTQPEPSFTATLRRSNSSKYKPRPRSWQAGTLINAARKLR